MTELKAAMKSLEVHYQPIVAASDLSIIGHEALVRVPALSGGPLALFALAERAGLASLRRLTRLIRAAVAAAMERMAPDMLVFVNLHPEELWDDELFSPACPLFAHRRRVVLELSERARFPEAVRAHWRMEGLRTLGYTVAMDDFGTGHAELLTLAEIGPDVVKLDRSMIRDRTEPERPGRALGAIAAMCRTLDIRIVAEGIETESERRRAVNAGCQLLQGYLFARPAFPPLASLAR